MKKLFVLSLLLFLSSPITQADTHFPDVEDNAWFAPYVHQAVDEGLMEGYPDGRFGSWDPINRAEFSKVILTLKEQLQNHWWRDNWVEIILVLITIFGWHSILSSMRKLVENHSPSNLSRSAKPSEKSSTSNKKQKSRNTSTNAIEKNLKSNWWVD